jgi:hypothetical protein
VNTEYNYPQVESMTADELRSHGWFVDATLDDIDFSTPDGSPLNPYRVEDREVN